MYTQVIGTVEDLFILLIQSKHMFHIEHTNKTNFLDERIYATEGKEQSMREYSRQREVRREDLKVESKTEGNNTKGI